MVGDFKLETTSYKKVTSHAREVSTQWLGYDIVLYEGYAYGIIRRHVCDIRSRALAMDKLGAGFEQIKDTEEGKRQIPVVYRIGICAYLNIAPATLQIIVDGVVKLLREYAKTEEEVVEVVKHCARVSQENNEHIGLVDDIVIRASKLINQDHLKRGVINVS